MPAELQALPGWLLVTLFVLVFVQIALEVVALVVLVRTPRDRLRLITNPWGWAAIILLVNTIGAIVFLVAGRGPAEGEHAYGAGSSGSADALGLLYGPDDRA